MKKMPRIMPQYNITKLDSKPFAVKLQEFEGFSVPLKVGERCTMACYEFPERERDWYREASVVGRASVHGLVGTEVVTRERGCCGIIDRNFVVQTTGTHQRILADSYLDEDSSIKEYETFLDKGHSLTEWKADAAKGAVALELLQRGHIHRKDNEVTTPVEDKLRDVVGCYQVEIGERSFQTVCVCSVQAGEAIESICEDYIDRHGRTVLTRIFCKDAWREQECQKQYEGLMPHDEHLIVNGEVLMHVADCISDYVL